MKYGSYEILSDNMKKNIKKTRKWSLIFLLVTIFLKYILSMVVNLDDWVDALIGIAATLIYGYLSYKARAISISH
jgi:hypothetical protein